MSLRLLRAEIWREPGAHGLQRVTARSVTANMPDGSQLDRPVGIVHARLVVTGADGHRLHEELIAAGVAVEGSRTRPLGVGEVNTLLATAIGDVVEGDLERELLELHRERTSVLETAYLARARTRTESLQRTLDQRRDEEIEKITAVLEELRRQITVRARPTRLILNSPCSRPTSASRSSSIAHFSKNECARFPRRSSGRLRCFVAAMPSLRITSSRLESNGCFRRRVERMSRPRRRTGIAAHHVEWMQLLDIDGPFLSVAVLAEVFPEGLDPEDREEVANTRAAFEAWQTDATPATLETFARSILEELLEYGGLVSAAPRRSQCTSPRENGAASTRSRRRRAGREADVPRHAPFRAR